MLSQKLPANKELQDADTALRRAALKAKEDAERLGTPYVIAEKVLPLLNNGAPIKTKSNTKAA